MRKYKLFLTAITFLEQVIKKGKLLSGFSLEFFQEYAHIQTIHPIKISEIIFIDI